MCNAKQVIVHSKHCPSSFNYNQNYEHMMTVITGGRAGRFTEGQMHSKINSPTVWWFL